MKKTKAHPPGDNHPSSMRRLSSLASLHSILSFSRSRRTTASTEDISIISDASTAADESVIRKSRAFEDNVSKKQPPAFRAHDNLRGKYVNLPGEDTSSLPRSKTFSSLPIATKSRKITELEHARKDLPGVNALPPRTTTARRYLPFGNIARSKPMTRSDTEPLISLHARRDVEHPDGKENIPARPNDCLKVRRVSPLDASLFDSDSYSTLLPVFGPIPPMPLKPARFAQTSPVKPIRVRKPLVTERSAIKEDLPQRWQSEPNLIDQEGRDRPRRRPVDHPARPPRSPVRQHTPLLPTDLFSGALTSSLLQASRSQHRLSKLVEEQNHRQAPQASVRVVLDAQPTAYWSGRLSALLDRVNANGFAEHEAGIFSSRKQTDKLYSKEGFIARIRIAFEELYDLCLTEEAKESFVKFQLQYAAIAEEPAFAKPLGKVKSHGSKIRPLGIDSRGSGTTMSSTRKFSFVDRLLGRSQRASLS